MVANYNILEGVWCHLLIQLQSSDQPATRANSLEKYLEGSVCSVGGQQQNQQLCAQRWRHDRVKPLMSSLRDPITISETWLLSVIPSRDHQLPNMMPNTRTAARHNSIIAIRRRSRHLIIDSPNGLLH